MTELDQTKSPKNILLIDDDIKFSIGMVALLKREGYEVTNSRNGKEGLEILKTSIPDLILCDVMMPNPDGMEVKTILNGDNRFRNIPFIFISAKTTTSDQEKAKALGVSEYILKPFVVKDVLEKIERLIG